MSVNFAKHYTLMKIKFFFTTCLFSILYFLSVAQSMHISGNMYLSPKNGLVRCVLKFDSLPAGENYRLRLNNGFNLKYFKLGDKFLDMNIDRSYSPCLYTLYMPGDTSPIKNLTGVTIAYTGAFPVYSDTDTCDYDDMGVIGVKNEIIRASSQSVFLPELFDASSRKIVNTYAYNLSVKSDKKITVYLNGLAPKTGTDLNFSTNKPLGFILYAGNYKVKHSGNVYVLNSDLSKRQIELLVNETKRISDFYAQLVGKPYNDVLVFPQIFTIGPKKQYENWGFTVTPTILMNLNQMVNDMDIKNLRFTNPEWFRIIAHEMGHKYQAYTPNTKNLWRFYHETFSQFLAYKAVLQYWGDSVFNSILAKDINYYSGDKNYPSFYEIENSKRDLTTASYHYYPLLFIGFNKMFGDEKTKLLLHFVYSSIDEFKYDEQYFIQQIIKTGISKEQFESYKKNYLESNDLRIAFKK